MTFRKPTKTISGVTPLAVILPQENVNMERVYTVFTVEIHRDNPQIILFGYILHSPPSYSFLRTFIGVTGIS